MAIYAPAGINQWDGLSSCKSLDCGPAVAAMAVARDWLGAKTATAKAIRDWITTHYSLVGCQVTYQYQLAAAVAALYSTTLIERRSFPWDDFVKSIVDGRAAILLIKYSVVNGTAFNPCHCDQPASGHFIYVNERKYNTVTGSYDYKVWDPNTLAYAWWSESLLKEAARYSGSTGTVLDALFTRDTEGLGEKKVICSGGRIYVNRGLKYASISVARGALVTASILQPGLTWTAPVCGIGQTSGDRWFGVTAVDGTPLGYTGYMIQPMLDPV